MAKSPVLVLLALCMTLLWPPGHAAAAAVAEEVNPCRSATLTATAADNYLDLVYHVSLSNPTGHAASVTVLSHIEFLEKVEGVTDDMVLNRQGDALVALVPSGWKGEVVIRAKARISGLGQTGLRSACIALPPAVSRSMDFDLPGRNVELTLPADPKAGDRAIVLPLGAQGDRSRFSVVPLSGDLFAPQWSPVPPARPAGYSLRETHRITEDAPAYADDVTLQFAFAGTPPAFVRATVPQGVAISKIQLSDAGRWKIAGGRLEISVPQGFAGDHLTAMCHLDGAAQPDADGAQTLTVPLFSSPDAERHTGAVTVNGGRHELAFAALEDARQTAAEGWRLACEFEGAAVRVAVRVVPMPVRRVATVETHYAVSEYRVLGTHRVSLKTEGEEATALSLLLPPATTARAVTGDVRNWSQEGSTVRIDLAARPGAVPQVEVTTESLTGGRLKLELAPPTVADATSSDFAMAVTHVPEVLLKTALAEAPWRVTPDALPDWLRQTSPPIAYHYRDAAPAVELEALPVEPDLRGAVQDHVTVSADRIQRDTLFLIEIQKRAVAQLDLLLPPGLTPESVEGPYVESWDIAAAGGAAPGGSHVVVRFPAPLTGGIHLRLVSSQPAAAGPLSLRGIRLAGAPALHGWIGIGTDVSMRVRPVEEGSTNLATIRTDQAPAYLAAFGNKIVYEFYSTDWQLDLAAESVPSVYDAEVLNVLSFSASGVEASAFVKVKVAQGGLTELELRVPAGAATPQVDAPDAVMVRWSEGVGLVRFRGPRSGAFTLRVDYALPTGSAASSLSVEPVRVTGARAQSGVLLLVQARPDVDVKAAQPPRALQPVEAEQQYAGWSYRREHPALAAYAYRETGWSLPVSVAAHPLSEQMLQAIIPLAKLDTIVQDGGETLNHLRLYVTNTTQQFLTVDLAKLDPQARLIGTYVYGEPVKPFRQGKTVLELPLFANETAARVGMSVIDITYAAPTSSLALMSRSRFELPDLGLNVGKVEWTVRLPQDYRLTDVGGNLDKPVAGPPPVRGLAERLAAPVADYVRRNVRGVLTIAIVIAILAGLVVGLRFLARLLKRSPWAVIAQAAVVIVILVILAGLLMPALSVSRRSARLSSESSNLHNIGMALSMYREDHGGTYPADLDMLKESVTSDPSIYESPNGEDVQLIYRRPAPNPAPTEVVAYFLHPDSEGANVLFADGVVQWTQPDSSGNLRNPRAAGEVLAAGSGMAGGAAASVAVGKRAAFAGTGVKTEELAEALQLGQQMAQQRAPSANQPVDAGRLNAALVEANRDKIELAKDKYAQEHKGQQPGSAGDISSYIEDSRLRQAVRELGTPVQGPVTGTGLAILARKPTDEEQASSQAEMDQLARSRYSLGNAYVQRGDYDEAEKQYTDALKLDASNLEARRGLDQLRALRSEVKGQEAQVAARPEAAPAQAAAMPAQPQALSTPAQQEAKAATDLKTIEKQLEQQEMTMSYKAVGPQGKAASMRGGMGGAGMGKPAAPPAPQAGPVAATIAAAKAPSAGLPTVTTGGRAAAAAEQELAVMQPRLGKASLVRQVAGGRSIGALPIQIDFPAPATVSYEFVKPFLGRAEANVSFRVLRTGSVMLLELVLAAVALIGFGLACRRAPRAGAGYAAVALAVSFAGMAAAPATFASAFGAAALAMGVCLAAEVIHLTFLHIHGMRTGS